MITPVDAELVIRYMADACVNMPWGLEYPDLKKDPESQMPYNRFLHNYVMAFKPQVALECGVYRATATRHMARGNLDTLVIGVDEDFHSSANSNVASYSNIVLITGNTIEQNTVEMVAALVGNRKIGLLFLDSAHDGITPSKEFELYKPFFASPCLVACDDVGPQSMFSTVMKDFWDNLPGQKIELHQLHPAQHKGQQIPGFGVSIVT